MKKILLTGRPCCGKTSLIKKIIEKLAPIYMLGGYYTEAIIEDHVRVGYIIMTVNGEQAVVSHARNVSNYSDGKFKVDIDVLEDFGANALLKAKASSDIIIIDGIGKAEIFSELMRLSIIEAFDSGKNIIGSMDDIDDPFMEQIKKRDDVEFMAVTSVNKDAMVGEIIQKVSS